MNDIQLYRHLLGIEAPWTVSRVKLNLADRAVEVWLDHPSHEQFPCAECDRDSSVYDHAPERVWRHLNSCHLRTLVHASIPRVKCIIHGVRQVRVPWAEPNARFTMLFERLAIDVMRECNVAGAADILGLTWEEADYIMARAVRRGLLRKGERVCEYIGVDEKAVQKRHRYATIVCDLKKGVVEYVGKDRTRETLDNFYDSLTYDQLSGIKGVAMDMWAPYKTSTVEHVPDGASKIVFDRFHIAQHMGVAVDRVRRQEHKQFLKCGPSPLVRTKYLWLASEENLRDKDRARFDELKVSNLKTARAWAIKESLRQLWACEGIEEARAFWKRWYFWATHSRLEPIKEVAKTIKRHLDNVLTYFTIPITNAMSEGLNSKLQTLKQKANGYRNVDNFIRVVFFHCGGLDLYPTHGDPG